MKNIEEEQMMLRHQSSPRPTAEEAVEAMAIELEQKKMNQQAGITDGFSAVSQVIGVKEIQKAQAILNKYKEGK